VPVPDVNTQKRISGKEKRGIYISRKIDKTRTGESRNEVAREAKAKQAISKDKVYTKKKGETLLESAVTGEEDSVGRKSKT